MSADDGTRSESFWSSVSSLVPVSKGGIAQSIRGVLFHRGNEQVTDACITHKASCPTFPICKGMFQAVNEMNSIPDPDTGLQHRTSTHEALFTYLILYRCGYVKPEAD